MFLFIASLSSAPVALICLIVALILFALAALNVPSTRVSLGWAGLFFLTLAMALG
jgi:hypothetical protein